MTVHAIQFVCAPTDAAVPLHRPTPEPPTLPSVVPQRVSDNVLATFAEVLPEQASPTFHMDGSVPGEVERLSGLRRFDMTESKTDLLDAIEKQVVGDAEWYVVRYHECTHDDPAGDPCPTWTDERTHGTIPEGV